jgi:hypothetical protein
MGRRRRRIGYRNRRGAETRAGTPSSVEPEPAILETLQPYPGSDAPLTPARTTDALPYRSAHPTRATNSEWLTRHTAQSPQTAHRMGRVGWADGGGASATGIAAMPKLEREPHQALNPNRQPLKCRKSVREATPHQPPSAQPMRFPAGQHILRVTSDKPRTANTPHRAIPPNGPSDGTRRMCRRRRRIGFRNRRDAETRTGTPSSTESEPAIS